jgi:CRISPR system Cascade subunit CasA
MEIQANPKLSFDLRRESWIPAVRDDGTREELGLIEVLCQAHELREVSDALPPVECGLLRLLVAFALDIFPLRDGIDWEELWEAGRFTEDRLLKYFEEEWPDRFDLFDEQHPFLQSADFGGDDKPLAGLIPSQPSGTNAAHFHHGEEGDFAVAPAIAARLLTTIAPFMTAGGAGLSPSINGAPPWYVLLQGRNNLFETILLNCPTPGQLPEFVRDDTPPAWRDERPIQKEDRTEAGLLESLTWRPRRIRLQPHLATNGRGVCALSGIETPILVARMKFSAAWSTRFDWRDPHVPYRFNKDGASVLRPRENREVWRDAGALALLRHSDDSGRDVTFERPAVVSQFAQWMQEQRLPADFPLQIAVYGMRTDLKMKVFEWQRARLNLPAPLLWKEQFCTQAEAEMKRADDIAYALAQAIKHTYPREGKGNDKAFNTLIARAQSDFWNRLRLFYTDAPDSLLHRLAPLQLERDKAEIEAALAEWHGRLQSVAHKVLWDSIGDLDTDAEAIKRQIEAQRQFGARVWALLHPAEAEARKKEKAKKKGDKA